jgi:hypothetical protein
MQQITKSTDIDCHVMARNIVGYPFTIHTSCTNCAGKARISSKPTRVILIVDDISLMADSAHIHDLWPSSFWPGF